MPNYRRIPLAPLAGGVRSDRHPTRIDDGQSPSALNVEFSADSVRSISGSRKLNNQTLVRPAVRCSPDPAYSPLYVEAGKSVPLRGRIDWPYDAATDIGGVDAGETITFHNRRGRTFERQLSFRIPETFRMHEQPARGEGGPVPGNAELELRRLYDEALDDCTLLWQKGGEGTTPLSWAIGIVGAGNHQYTAALPGSDLARKSNYFLVFMWLDVPEWGASSRINMRYDLATYANNATGQYSTQALRAVILDGRNDTVAYALEPGKQYNLSIAITLDSLTGGTTWAHDGRVDIRLQEQHGRFWSGSFVDSVGGGTTTNLTIWKGPTDSLRYLAKFGIRYHGRDMEFGGLGYRGAPWKPLGWIPYGHDSSSMETKGFRFADISLNSISDLYGALDYDLTGTHAVAGNTYIDVTAHRGLVLKDDSTVGEWGRVPWEPSSSPTSRWDGYGGLLLDIGAPASDFNPQALRGYRIVFPRSADGTMNALRGGRMTIESYSEVALNDYRLEVANIEFLGVTWASAQPFLISAFRWNQQPVELQEMRCWASSRDYSNPRVVWSMQRSILLDDETEPEIAKLQAYLPLDDGGGRVCKEAVRGNDAFLAPFGLALPQRGARGDGMLYLSGDGEALVYDLSDNPVFEREMKAMLASNSRGLAIEITCILPQAYYGIAVEPPANPIRNQIEASHCPDIISISVKGADESGASPQAMPLLTMGHHSWWNTGFGVTPARDPQGFHVDYHAGLDSDVGVMATAVLGAPSIGSVWDLTAPWVGKRITIQVGIQPSPDNRNGVANMENEFRVYLAATPKGVFKYAAGEDPQAEFAYFADVIIQKKDIPRLVVTIGGGWNPAMVRGYTEYSCRLLIDEVRVYGTTAPGELPATSGAVTADRRGKILGRNALPARALTDEDLLQPLGAGTRSCELAEGSTVVTAPGDTSFFTQLPEATRDSVREKFLVPRSDTFKKPSVSVFQEEIQEFYWIEAVAADGETLTLATPYAGPASPRASAGATSLVGYTDFNTPADELLRSPLSLGSGEPYQPGVTTTNELVLTDALFPNRAAIDGDWKIRVASPFTEGGLAQILPQWTRGIVSPRRGLVTGIQALDDAVFAAGRGAIFRIDDRWREDGPTSSLRNSLSFSGKPTLGLGLTFPLAFDAARFARYENAWPYWSTAISRDFTWIYDFWVYIEEYGQTQTLMWLGCEYSHLLLGAASSDHRRGIGVWLRLSDGRPEVVRQSAGNFSGGSQPPPESRYIGTAADRIPLRRWTHVRFWLEHQQSGGIDVVRLPGISINGRRSAVVVNAVETGLASSSDWIQTNNGGGLIGSAGDTRNALYLGVARDAVKVGAKSQFTAVDQLGGREYQGGRLVGFMHPLLGRMSGATVWRVARTDPLAVGFPDFDPYTLDYTGRLVRFKADLQEGVGEHLDDAGTDVEIGFGATVPGVVLSHPAIDLYNEFGDREQAVSFAVSERRVFAANGGRPAAVTEMSGGPAGVIPPTTRPSVEVERKPLWEPNKDPDDPIAVATRGAGQQINHYSTFGNNYMRQRWHEDMRWAKDDAAANTPFDILGFKGYWHPRSISGTVPIYSSRGSRESGGPFIECVDGRVRVGWYDTELKKQVSVTSNSPIFRPGYWYYIYLRKAFTLQDLQEGNWLNSFWANGRRRRANFTIGVAGWAVGDIVRNGAVTKRGLVTKVYAGTIEYVLFSTDADFAAAEAVNNGSGATGTITATPFQNTGDALVIREFQKAADPLNELSLWHVKTGVRLAVSFTSAAPRSTNTTAIGQVTPKGALFSGTAGGLVNIGTMLGAATPLPLFTGDMVGMQFQFASTVANSPEKVYRISARNSATQIAVLDEHGVAPNLSAFTDRGGGVFSGLELIKGDDFDASRMPDQGNYDVEFIGTSLCADPANGYAPFIGKAASFAWGVASSLVSSTAFYSGFNIFETATPTELSEIGTDSFTAQIYSVGTRPGELRVDSARAFMCVDTQPYAGATAASTQPNSALAVAKDTEASANAESLYWRYVQEPMGWTGRRVVYVAFFDADQDVRSNPGPRLVVEVPEEDQANPSGLARLLLTNLPISHQLGRIERHVFVTDADLSVPFRAAIVPDNISSSVGVTLDDNYIDRSDILEFDNSPPPNCGSIGISQAVMFYGDVEVSGIRVPSAILFSKPFLHLQVPFANFLTLIGGSNDQITGMTDLNGVLLVWKRDSMFEVVVREGAALQIGKSRNVGLVGPQALVVLDQDVYWLSYDRGLYVYMGSGGPVWLGEAISDIFDGLNQTLQVDGRTLERASLAVHRRNDQVVAAVKILAELDQRRRFAIEYDGGLSGSGVADPTNGWRYALFAGPNVTALGSADRSVPGGQRFLAGTAEGFVAELDRIGSQLELHEPGLATTATLTAGSTSTKLVLAAPITGMTDLEGLRGVPVEWDTGRATILFTDGSNLYLDRALTSIPASGTVVSIGAIPLSWTSKLFNLGTAEERKTPEYLDLVLARQSGGQAVVEAFVDGGSTPLPLYVLGAQTSAPTLDLTQLVHRIPLSEIRGQFVQFRVRTLPPAVGVSLEILEAVMRVTDGELH